jgi:hypothetical protein
LAALERLDAGTANFANKKSYPAYPQGVTAPHGLWSGR